MSEEKQVSEFRFSLLFFPFTGFLFVVAFLSRFSLKKKECHCIVWAIDPALERGSVSFPGPALVPHRELPGNGAMKRRTRPGASVRRWEGADRGRVRTGTRARERAPLRLWPPARPGGEQRAERKGATFMRNTTARGHPGEARLLYCFLQHRISLKTGSLLTRHFSKSSSF